MRVEFEDDDLQRLYTDPDYRIPNLGPDVVRSFRKCMTVLVSAADERDLYALKSLHFEKLSGDRLGQRSLRLNKKWRLIVRLEENDDGRLAVVVEIVDYH